MRTAPYICCRGKKRVDPDEWRRRAAAKILNGFGGRSSVNEVSNVFIRNRENDGSMVSFFSHLWLVSKVKNSAAAVDSL